MTSDTTVRGQLEIVMDQMMMNTDLSYDGAVEKLIDQLKSMRSKQFMLVQVIALGFESRMDLELEDWREIIKDILNSAQVKYGGDFAVRRVSLGREPLLVIYEGEPASETELMDAVTSWTAGW